MTKILLIEDDPNICKSTRLLLKKTAEKWEMDEAHTGEEGLEIFSPDDHGLVLLDLMLPNMDGFETCRQLRMRSSVPIVILTAREDTHDIVAALSMGADDYVTKPFVAQELVARIRSMLRRVKFAEENGSKEKQVAVHGYIEVNPMERRIFRDKREVYLTRTEESLFFKLYESKGEAVSRKALSEAIWGERDFATERLVDIQISRLRTKLELDVATPRHIRTVRKVGYRFDP